MADKFRIVMTGPGQGKVYRNGEPVENVTAIEFSGAAGQPNLVKLTLWAAEVEIEAEAEESRG